MSENKSQDTVNEVLDQGKSLLNKASSRHLIIRKANGEKLADVSFLVAAVAVILLLWIPIGIPLALVGLAYGLYAKLKVEVVRDLGDGNTVVDYKSTNDEE